MKELLIHFKEEYLDFLSEDFMEIFPEGYVVYDKSTQGTKIFRDDLKEGEVIVGVYFEDDNEKKIVNSLNNLLENKLNKDEYYIVIQDYNIDWKNEWKKFFDPVKIGKIVITPKWNEHKIDDDKLIRIYIEPGMAFGTGQNETTQICAEYIQKYAEEKYNFMDIGTGTGILSIIASKFGIKDIIAFDVDPEAVKIAEENFAENSVSGVELFTGTIDKIKNNKKYSMVAANIISSILYTIIPKISNYITNDGYFIFSGILDSEKEEGRKVILSNGYEIIEEKTAGEWWGGIARRKI